MNGKRLTRILGTLKRLNPARREKSTLPPGYVSKALEKWIDDGRFAEESSVETVSVQLGLAPWMLTDYFRNEHGTRFTTWRKEIRLSKAAELLLEKPEMPASKVGEMVGIKDKSNFRNQFRKKTGLTPTQWRARHTASL
ncbi:MAG: helix-turn-helix transcriptional regulator [Bacteroidales bacterium]|nr:helix-turn-helix transcriptional regulator [Bacteroidales bacterium]